MRVFRLHVRPKGGDPRVSFAHCLENDVLGMGWPVESDSTPVADWEDYEPRAIERYGKKELSRVRYFHREVREGDLIWTRDPEGAYYLARVTGGWGYDGSPAAREADVVNFVPCDLRAIEEADEVPGKVVACFRATRTIQRIRNAAAVAYSKLLWNSLVGREVFEVTAAGDLFDYLDAEATEDLVFIYLQLRGWVVMPKSRKGDTMSYEFLLRHRETGETAAVQVKTGGEPVPRSRFRDLDRAFLFQPHGHYTGDPHDQVYEIPRHAIEDFMSTHRHVLPKHILHWMDHCGVPA